MKHLIGVYDYTVILTYISLFFAVLGMVLAAEGHTGAAVVCLMLAGLCDAFDGAVARTKKDRTEDEKNFGIQLDSLCDVVSFGVFPALLCYFLGVNGPVGVVLVGLYVLCAVIRLAFFNVLEMHRQKVETGSSKYFRGLPVTSMSMILPPAYCLKFLLPAQGFVVLLHVLLGVVAVLFVVDIRVRKLNWEKLLHMILGRK